MYQRRAMVTTVALNAVFGIEGFEARALFSLNHDPLGLATRAGSRCQRALGGDWRSDEGQPQSRLRPPWPRSVTIRKRCATSLAGTTTARLTDEVPV
jgi:hypothetical protein